MANKIIELDTTESTNTYACNLLKQEEPPEGTIIWAKEQTHGRGRDNNAWESEKGKNLTMSLILYPTFMKIEEQFLLSKVISIALFDYLSKFLSNVFIKWPNDIYVNNDKIAGILIENSIIGNRFAHTIIGIGLNVNQVRFSNNVPNPTSLKLQSGRDFDLQECFYELNKSINIRYEMLRSKNIGKINTDYLNHVYRYKILSVYQTEQREFIAKIIDVENNGVIVLETNNHEIRRYTFDEISFM
jgi:BirA family biotin operon repressor/biotin-[acetyl-CoA-carboxylase] ligase